MENQMLDRFKSRNANRTCVSVWPTDDAVAIAMVRKPQNGLPVLESCEYHPIKNRSEQPDLLKQILDSNKLDKFPCVSLLSSDNYRLMMVEAPDVTESELREAMRWRIKDMIDFPVEDAVIDVFDIPDQKSSGDMMYVVVAKSEVIARRVKLMLDAGFDLSSIDIMELAMRNVANLLPENDQGVAMVWLGLHSGSITLTKEDTLYFTRHLSGSEKLFGALYSNTVTEEMEGWLDTVVIEIQRTLDFFESQYQQPPAAGVVLVPLIKPVEGLTEYLSSQLGVNVRYLELENLFEINEDLDLDKVALCLPAIGAALNMSEVSS
jgi:MSHA biogenesis protein MshI